MNVLLLGPIWVGTDVGVSVCLASLCVCWNKLVTESLLLWLEYTQNCD